MKRGLLILSICLCAALVAVFASRNSSAQGQRAQAAVAAQGQKGKPTSGPITLHPAQMYFSNRDGDKIMGDIWGDYVDGVGGVECTVSQDPAGTCRFTLDIRHTSKPKRYLHYDFGSPSECVDSPEAGVVEDAGFMNINHVGDALVEVPGARGNTIYSPTVGYLVGPGADLGCNNAVVVYRLDQHNWVVSTDKTYGSPLPNPVNNLVPIGDNRMMNQTYIYHMPWEMHIYCPNCCAPNDPYCTDKK